LVLVGRIGLVAMTERLVLHQCSAQFRPMVVAVVVATLAVRRQQVAHLDRVVVQAKLRQHLHQVHQVRV
jgi:hypothetical protein